jgi:hypothetical protein
MADLHLIVLGPRKRKDPSRFEDNGDPGPVSRNKKIKPALVATEKPLPRAQQHHPSVQDLEAGDEANVAITARQAPPQNTSGIAEEDNGSGDEAALENDDKNPIDVDEEVDGPVKSGESAEDELGESD